MSDGRKRMHPSRVNHKRPKWLEEISSPKEEEAIRKKAEEIRNGPEPPPTLEEVRAMMDEAFRGRTLKEVMRDLDDRFEKELADSESEGR